MMRESQEGGVDEFNAPDSSHGGRHRAASSQRRLAEFTELFLLR